MHAPVLVKRREVEVLTRLSRSSIYAAMRAGTFPQPVKIGQRAVAWRRVEVEQWIASRPLAGSVRPA